MAERTILVCDSCGRPAAETVTIRTSKGNFVKDQCGDHVDELMSGARKPRPGRRKGSTNKRAAAAAPKKAPAKRKTTAKKKSTAKRRGRPKKS